MGDSSSIITQTRISIQILNNENWLTAHLGCLHRKWQNYNVFMYTVLNFYNILMIVKNKSVFGV